MENIYEQYGKLMIEQEILNARIMEVKRTIAEELNSQSVKKDITEKNKKDV